MKLTAPTVLLFLISLALAVTSLLGVYRPDLLPPEAAGHSFQFMLAAWAVLAFGVLLRKT